MTLPKITPLDLRQVSCIMWQLDDRTTNEPLHQDSLLIDRIHNQISIYRATPEGSVYEFTNKGWQITDAKAFYLKHAASYTTFLKLNPTEIQLPQLLAGIESGVLKRTLRRMLPEEQHLRRNPVQFPLQLVNSPSLDI